MQAIPLQRSNPTDFQNLKVEQKLNALRIKQHASNFKLSLNDRFDFLANGYFFTSEDNPLCLNKKKVSIILNTPDIQADCVKENKLLEANYETSSNDVYESRFNNFKGGSYISQSKTEFINPSS